MHVPGIVATLLPSLTPSPGLPLQPVGRGAAAPQTAEESQQQIQQAEAGGRVGRECGRPSTHGRPCAGMRQGPGVGLRQGIGLDLGSGGCRGHGQSRKAAHPQDSARPRPRLAWP